MFKKYYELTKPGIIRGNIMNTAGGFLLASTTRIETGRLLFTLAGTALVIACACVLNNFIDRNIDSKMARTKNRALVAGEISPFSALLFATILGVGGFIILVAGTNALTAVIGLVALVMYVAVYGYFKRRTPFGTLVGSIPGALPPVAGYTAAKGQLDTATGLVFIILVTWQMAHFYSIAMYRYKDYKNAGIPVLPVTRGFRRTRVSVSGYIAAFILANALMTLYGYTGYTYLLVMTGFGIIWLYLGLRGIKTADGVQWGRKMFFFSLSVILALAIMLSVGARLP